MLDLNIILKSRFYYSLRAALSFHRPCRWRGRVDPLGPCAAEMSCGRWRVWGGGRGGPPVPGSCGHAQPHVRRACVDSSVVRVSRELSQDAPDPRGQRAGCLHGAQRPPLKVGRLYKQHRWQKLVEYGAPRVSPSVETTIKLGVGGDLPESSNLWLWNLIRCNSQGWLHGVGGQAAELNRQGCLCQVTRC